MDSKKKQKNKLNKSNLMIILLILTAIIVVIALAINIIHVNQLAEDTENINNAEKSKYTNDFYTIGNNPTEINKTYFDELTEAVETSDTDAMAETVVKCFVTEYYTWTNKDGNYDIGGMQYIYANKQSDFETYTLYNFYEDLDLYLTQYGSDNLIQVKEVNTGSAAPTGDYEVFYSITDPETAITTDYDEYLPCVTVEASWNYEDNGSLDTSVFQNHAVFYVVNNNGRMEIAGIDNDGSEIVIETTEEVTE